MINQLIRAAKKSPKRFKHASLVIKGGAILAIGYNHDKVHSEIAALEKLWPNKRKGVTVINIRINKHDKLVDSSPCERCRDYMRKWKIRRCLVTLGQFLIQEIPIV